MAARTGDWLPAPLSRQYSGRGQSFADLARPICVEARLSGRHRWPQRDPSCWRGSIPLLRRRDHRLTVGREVVWIKMLGGGSLLLAMPMLLGFRRAHPETRMVLITTPGVRPFAELMGVFDEYRIIDVSGIVSIATSAARVLAGTLRADCIVDLEVHCRLTTVFATLTMALNR